MRAWDAFMRQSLALLAVLLLVPSIALAQSIGVPEYTAAQANASISVAANYINGINESGFLLFQPNLTQSYGYLKLAEQFQNASPGTAVFYAGKAQSAAVQQYQDISYYRSRSVPVMVAFTLLFLLILVKLGVPVVVHKRGSKYKRR